jgi:hypothetical protein
MLTVSATETDLSGTGYSSRLISEGTWAVIDPLRTNATRVYAVTEDDMKNCLRIEAPYLDIENSTKEKLIQEYLKVWDYESLSYISVYENNSSGIGTVKLFTPSSSTGTSFANCDRLAKLVPNEGVAANGFPGWYRGIASGQYGLDKIKTVYAGYTIPALPASQQNKTYSPDYQIYNSNGTLKPESMTYTALEALNKLNAVNNGENVYIFFQVGIKPFIKVGEGQYIATAYTDMDEWGSYSAKDEFSSGGQYVEALKKYNGLHNSAYTDGTDVRWNNAVLNNWLGANYIKKAILGKYLTPSYPDGAMDTLFVSYTDPYTHNTEKLHLQTDYEQALGVGYQEVKSKTEIPLNTSVRIKDYDSGATIKTFGDIAGMYALVNYPLANVGYFNYNYNVEGFPADLRELTTLLIAMDVKNGRSFTSRQEITYTDALTAGFYLLDDDVKYGVAEPMFVDMTAFRSLPSDKQEEIGASTALTRNHFKLENRTLKGALCIPYYLGSPFINSSDNMSFTKTLKVRVKSASSPTWMGEFHLSLTSMRFRFYNPTTADEVYAPLYGANINENLSHIFNLWSGAHALNSDNPLVIEFEFETMDVMDLTMKVVAEYNLLDGTKQREPIASIGSVTKSTLYNFGGIEHVLKQSVISDTHESGSNSVVGAIKGYSYRTGYSPVAIIAESPNGSEVTVSTYENYISDTGDRDFFHTSSRPYWVNQNGKHIFTFESMSEVNNYRNNVGTIVVSYQQDMPSTPIVSGDYTIEENMLTRYYPQLTGGNFNTFTVSKNSYSPTSGSRTASISETTDTTSMNLPKSYNGVSWDSSKGDSHSYITNSDDYTWREYELQAWEVIEAEHLTEKKSIGTITCSRITGPPPDSIYRSYVHVKDLSETLAEYEVFTCSRIPDKYGWVDQGEYVETCSPSGSDRYGDLPTSTPYAGTDKRWDCIDDLDFLEIRDYTHTYTFKDTYNNLFDNYEEYGVRSTESMPELIHNALNTEKFKSSTSFTDLTMSGIDTTLLFSRSGYGDLPTLASWKGSGASFPLNLFPCNNRPVNVRKPSGSTTSYIDLVTQDNKIRWKRIFDRGLFSNVFNLYTSFSVPTLPRQNINLAVKTFVPTTKSVINTPVYDSSKSGSTTTYRITSPTPIYFYPEVPMKYYTTSGSEGTAYVVGEVRRVLTPVTVHSISTTAIHNENLVLNAPYARDAKAKALNGRISGYDGVLPSGSAFSLESITPKTFTLTSYFLRVKAAYSSAWGNPTDTSLSMHQAFVNSFMSAIPTTLKFKLEGQMINNFASQFKFNAVIEKTKSAPTTKVYDVGYINDVTTSPALPATTLDQMELSGSNSRLLNALQKNSGEGNWYNEQTTGTLEIVRYVTTVTLTKPFASGILPFDIGPDTGEFTDQFREGYRAEFYYDIVPAQTFTIMGKPFGIGMTVDDTGFYRRFIISDTTTSDY